MILRPHLEPTDSQSVLNYYIDQYDEVHLVVCDKCKSDLGIEVKGEIAGYRVNEKGYTVLGFGDKLLASRVRLDGTMGYQCVCGNDTRGTQLEQELSPNGTFLPHEVAAIREAQDKKKWRPKLKVKGNKETHETFIRERVK